MKNIVLLILLCFLSSVNSQEITQEQADAFNALRSEANSLVTDYLIIHGQSSKAVNKKKILKGIELYKQALDIYPYHWQTYWTKGKAYQAIKDFENGYYAFKQAYELNNNHPDVINELLIAMTDSGRFSEAIALGKVGIDKFPDRYGIRANIAVAHLLSGELDKSIIEAQKALKANSNDAVTKLIIKVAKEIQSGKRTQPKSMQELLNDL